MRLFDRGLFVFTYHETRRNHVGQSSSPALTDKLLGINHTDCIHVPEAWTFIEIAAASPCGATLKFPSSAATNTCKSSKQSRGMACVASNRIRYGSRGRCILCVSAPGERPLQDLPLCSPGGAGRRTGCCVMVVMQDSHLRNITT